MARRPGKEKLLLVSSRSAPSIPATKLTSRAVGSKTKPVASLQLAGAMLISHSQSALPEIEEVRRTPKGQRSDKRNLRDLKSPTGERASVGSNHSSQGYSPRSVASPRNFSIPGRRVAQCFSFSKTGTNHGRPKPYNQDSAMTSRLEVPNNPHLLLVCDGHGELGHTISTFITSMFPQRLLEALQRGEGRFDPAVGAMVEAFQATNDGLKTSGGSGKYSGSTCIAVLVERDQLVCGNVGDSKAVLCRREAGQCVAIPLSREHTPSDPVERLRIEEAGGRVKAIAQSGSLRVWFQDEDSPGLAMSRALGDFDAEQIGVIATPGTSYTDVTNTPISESDLFIIVASDGLWEYMSSLEAVLIVEELRLQGLQRDAARVLVEEAVKRWRNEEHRVDDITAVVAFLET